MTAMQSDASHAVTGGMRTAVEQNKVLNTPGGRARAIGGSSTETIGMVSVMRPSANRAAPVRSPRRVERIAQMFEEAKQRGGGTTLFGTAADLKLNWPPPCATRFRSTGSDLTTILCSHQAGSQTRPGLIAYHRDLLQPPN